MTQLSDGVEEAAARSKAHLLALGAFRDRLAKAYCVVYHDGVGFAHPDHDAAADPPCVRGYREADLMIGTGLLDV